MMFGNVCVGIHTIGVDNPTKPNEGYYFYPIALCLDKEAQRKDESSEDVDAFIGKHGKSNLRVRTTRNGVILYNDNGFAVDTATWAGREDVDYDAEWDDFLSWAQAEPGSVPRPGGQLTDGWSSYMAKFESVRAANSAISLTSSTSFADGNPDLPDDDEGSDTSSVKSSVASISPCSSVHPAGAFKQTSAEKNKARRQRRAVAKAESKKKESTVPVTEPLKAQRPAADQKSTAVSPSSKSAPAATPSQPRTSKTNVSSASTPPKVSSPRKPIPRQNTRRSGFRQESTSTPLHGVPNPFTWQVPSSMPNPYMGNRGMNFHPTFYPQPMYGAPSRPTYANMAAAPPATRTV